MFKIFWIATIIYTIVFSLAVRVNVPAYRFTRAQYNRVCRRFWWVTLATTPVCLVNANAYLLRLEQLKKLI